MADELENQDTELDLDGGDELQPSPEKKTEAGSPELATILSELNTNVKSLATPKETQKQEKEMTEDEKAEYWGVYNPEKSDPDFFKKFLRLNTDMDEGEIRKAVEAFRPIFAGMQKGMVKQALVGAMRMMEARLAERDEKNKPVHEYVSQSRARELRQRFNDSYPVLSDKRYDKIVRFFAKEQEGKNFDSEESFFKTLAESVAEHIKSIDPSFDLGAEVEPQKKKTAGTPPRLPRGGAGGGGGAGGRDSSSATSRNHDFAADVLS